MNKKLYKKEERGLKGGPNYQVSEMFGAVTSTGYWPDSPDRNNDFNIIPSNQITMEGMDMDLIGQDDQGNIQYMTPGNNYTFPGNYVTETPVAKQGGMFLGNYTFKNGGLVKMDNGGPEKRKKDPPFKQVWERFDISSPEGLRKKQAWSNYNASTDIWWDALEKEQKKIGRELSEKEKEKWIQKQARSNKGMEGFKYNREKDPRFEFLFNPKQNYDPGSGLVGFELPTIPVKPNWTPDELKLNDAKQEFLNQINSDPLQKALGQEASLKNPNTRAAAENYARYKVYGEKPGNKVDQFIRGNREPGIRDFYEPHAPTYAYAVPAAMVTAPIVAEAAITGAPVIAEALSPYARAADAFLNAPRFGNPWLTGHNLFKAKSAYDIAFKYGPRAVYDAEQYYKTGDIEHLKNLGYNVGKSFLEAGTYVRPIAEGVSAVKKPISLIDDARKTAQAETGADATESGMKTVKNIIGYLKKEGGGIYLGAYKKVGGQLVPHDISVPNLSRQNGGEMPFGLPLKEQNIYTLPEYNQPINPMTGEILPDPQRPNLGMDTGATEYKYTYGFDDGDVDVPSIVAGQYIGDQAIDRYRLTGERFKTMADPGSYSKFYDQIGQLGLMQEKHGGSVKRVKIKSLPKNWKTK